jgi:hypothetical protein
MARYVRFIIHQRIRGDSRQLGIFSAAYYLRDEGELPRHDRVRLSSLLTWFQENLTVPPEGTIPARAIFWYGDVGPFTQPMWALARLIKDHGFTAEQITAKFIGRVVYQDRYQVAALPPTRRHR